jgi:hypothetical protein
VSYYIILEWGIEREKLCSLKTINATAIAFTIFRIIKTGIVFVYLTFAESFIKGVII